MSNEFKEWKEEMGREEAIAKEHGCCLYCYGDSSLNMIYQDSLTGDWYWDIPTNEWDSFDEDYIHVKEYIHYCPYCGRELKYGVCKMSDKYSVELEINKIYKHKSDFSDAIQILKKDSPQDKQAYDDLAQKDQDECRGGEYDYCYKEEVAHDDWR